MTPTPEQLSIVEAAVTTEDNLLVTAYAGAAKTTTLELICKALPGVPILSLAFNKKIAEEMSTRLPGNAKASTLNSIGHRVWAASLGRRITLDTRKSYRLLGEAISALPPKRQPDYRNSFSVYLKAIDAATTAGLIPPGLYPNATSLVSIDDYLASLEDEPDDMSLVYEVLHRRIQESYRGTIDFSDQIYMPALFGGTFPKFPLVLVDEAQDLSPINHSFIRRLVTRRIIAVGDPFQSIYGFRGAVTNGMSVLAETFAMRKLTLSVSFRCPRRMVELAHFRCPDMQAAPGAAEGTYIPFEAWRLDDIPDGAAVICRRNAPIFSLAFRLLRAGRSIRLAGGDIGPGMIRLLKSFGPISMPRETVKAKINEWRDTTITKRPSKAKSTADRAACLHIFADQGTDLGGAIVYAERLFSAEGAITLSSIHRAKGLEWNHVFHLDPWIIQPDEDDQEANLLYVAITRAKRRYCTINTDNLVESA